MADDKTLRKINPVHPTRMFPHEARVRQLLIIPETGTEPEDGLDPTFWAHIARDLQEFAEITAYCEDWSWRATYVVVEAGPNWAKVKLLEKHRFDKHTVEGRSFVLPGYTIEHKSSFTKWRVVREVDGQVVRDKFVTKADAEAWLVEYAKSLAA